MHDADNITRPVVYKLDPNGIPDPTFATNGIYNDIVLASQTEAYATASQGNKLVTTGYGRASTSESLDVLSLRPHRRRRPRHDLRDQRRRPHRRRR